MSRFIVPIIFILALDTYGFFALKPLFAERSDRSAQLFTIIWWSIPMITLAYMASIAFNIEPSWPRAFSIPARALLFIIYFAKFIGSGFFLIDDLRRILTAGFRAFGNTTEYWPDRSKFLTQMAIIAGGLPAAVLSYGIIRNPYRYELYEVDVPVKGLSPKHHGLRIAQISDIHSGSFFRSEPIRDGIKLLNDQSPDLVCFTGDLVNSKADEIEPFIDIFGEINSKLGSYSIIGNHDYGDYVPGWGEEEKAANWQLLERNHQRLGWDLMRNENRILDVNGEPLALIGVENWSTIDRFPRSGDLKKASAGTEGVLTKVLLSHDPTHWDAEIVGQREDIQLMLAGHTHGFQFGVEIPGFRWSPSQYLYDQWAGLYQKGNQHLYVNRGFGFLGYPGRVGILPEVTILRLVAA